MWGWGSGVLGVAGSLGLRVQGHVARECGVLTPEGTSMEGPVFRLMPEEDLIAALPKLQAAGVLGVWFQGFGGC